MSPLTCQHIQRRLLEPEAGRLSADEQDHLNLCPVCWAFARDVQGSGALVASVARQVQAQSPTLLPPALKNRVRAQIRHELAQSGTPPVAEPQPARVIALHGRRGEWLNEMRERLAAALVRWRWAAVAGAVALVFAAATVQYLQTRPIAKLEFASGPTALRTASLAQQHEGVGQWACRRGATLSTQANAAAHFRVGEGVDAAMAGDTTLQVLEKEKIALTQGTVWLHVTPGGKGFKVETPAALVQVTGTRFGVTVNGRETRVEVAEGSVAVTQEQSRGKVTAGLTLTAGPGGVTAPAPRAEGTNPPGWVGSLLAAERVARAGTYLPSLGKRP